MGGAGARGGAHRTQHRAMPDPVARHAKHRREQRPEILQRPEQRQRQYRAGLDQDVPACRKASVSATNALKSLCFPKILRFTL